jgi:hypothetical protein
VDALGQTGQVILVTRAGNDALVRLLGDVQTTIMAMIVNQDCPAGRGGVGQHLVIILAATSSFLNGQDIVSQVPQQLHDWTGKILVGIKLGYASLFIVQPDHFVNFGLIVSIVVPSNR